MIRLDEEMLRGLQLVELELLTEVDRICRKHDIPYCIIAGTLLGAKRHGGFIPWDDDADVALLREDYVRFREACKTELDPAKFYFQDHETTPGYRWGYGKLRRADTLFLREHQEHMPYEQGVFIDVFPLDEIPRSRAGRAAKNFECFCVRKLLWSPVGAVACKSPLARAWFATLSRIPEKQAKRALNSLIHRASNRTARSAQTRQPQTNNWGQSLLVGKRTNNWGLSPIVGKRAKNQDERWVRILMFPTPNREYGYRRAWYTATEPTVFEGITFAGIADADDYLSFKFGDWHELPPESKRKAHPVTGFKLPGRAEVRI